MMKPLYKQPVVEAVILASGILCTVVLIHGIQNFIALGGKPVTSQIAQKSNPDLVQVAAESNCPYSASVSMGQTAGGGEMRINPTSDPKVYDPFPQKYKNVLNGTKPPGTALAAGQKDTKLPILGSIFGYKPSSASYYQVLENDGSKLTGTTWEQYLLGIPTDVGAEIKAPQTGYDIGGGKMGLVVYATNDQITIHVGRHEYLTASSPESGGYWIYLKGLCVNQQLVAQYNANAASRTQLPELAKGELLGYATGSEVLVAVRDNGPFTDILAPEWWTGVSAKVVVPPGDGDGDPDTSGGGTKLGLGKDCTKNDECISNRCSANPPSNFTPKCLQGTLTQDAPCTDPSQCASKLCKDVNSDPKNLRCTAISVAVPVPSADPNAPGKTAVVVSPILVDRTKNKIYTLRVPIKNEAGCTTVGSDAFNYYPYCQLNEVFTNQSNYSIKLCTSGDCYESKLTASNPNGTGSSWNFTFTVVDARPVDVSTFKGYMVWDLQNDLKVNYIYDYVFNNLPGRNNNILEFITPIPKP